MRLFIDSSSIKIEKRLWIDPRKQKCKFLVQFRIKSAALSISNLSLTLSPFSARIGMTQFSVTPRFWLISFVYLTKGKIWPDPQRNLRRDRCEICVPLFSPSFAFSCKSVLSGAAKISLHTPTFFLSLDPDSSFTDRRKRRNPRYFWGGKNRIWYLVLPTRKW